MDTLNVKKYLDENYPDEELITFDGLDEAFIGVGYAFNKPIACYDKNKIIDLLMMEGMSYQVAEEYFSFNIAGAYLGENTPVIVDPIKDD